MYLKSKLHKPIATMNYEQFGQQRSVESKDCRLRRQTTYFFLFQRYRGTTRKLYTDARAQTAGRRSRSNRRVPSAANTTVLSNGSAYPAEAAGAAGSASVLPGHARPKSLEIENRMTSPDETVFGSGPDDVSRGGG